MDALTDAVDLPELQPKEGSSVHLLGYDAPLDWSVDGGTLTVTVPQAARQAVGEQMAYVFKVEGQE